MPKKLENKLKREARAKGYTGQRFNRYVYGTIARVEAQKKRKRRVKK